MVKRAVQYIRNKLTTIGEHIRRNKAELIRGSVLDPINHPSYSTDKMLQVYRAANHRDRTIKTANGRYENAVNI